MAVSSTTAPVCIPGTTTQSHKFGFSKNNGITFTLKPRRLCIRTSGGDDSTATEVESESSSSVEVPKESPSLISALNVERALRGIPITDADHYGRLGIPRDSPFDKILVAYNKKVQELESQGLEKEELNKKLELLKESYTILSSQDERRIYDWSLARAENVNKYIWPFEVDTTEVLSKGDPPPQEPEDFGPTRLVGYIILGWIMLSFVASIALNL